MLAYSPRSDRAAQPAISRKPAGAVPPRAVPEPILARQLALMVNRSANGHEAANVPDAPAASEVPGEAMRSDGQALDASTRGYFEPRFGRDFSQIRIHTDAQAARSAQAFDAIAYTLGRHIFFARGRYEPSTAAGKRLLAHELTHTVQQSHEATAQAQPLRLSHPEDAAEREADRAADDAVSGGHPSISRSADVSTVQRQPPQPNVGPPISEVPRPPTVNFIYENGKWYWQLRDVPKLGSAPKIPLDPRDIPREIKDKLPKGPAVPGAPPVVIPGPPPDSDWMKSWLDSICEREPHSPLCFKVPPAKQPDVPPLGTPAIQVGILWTDSVLFNQDHPHTAAEDTATALTPEGVKTLDSVILWLSISDTMLVRLTGHASSEGDTPYNQALSERRVKLVHRVLAAKGFADRVRDPTAVGPACQQLDKGMWACGESLASQAEQLPADRRVDVTFHRDLLSALPKLQMPEFKYPPQ